MAASKKPCTSIDEMRAVLIGLYDEFGWKYRVKNMMKQNQIIAIYAKVTDMREKLIAVNPHDVRHIEYVYSLKGRALTEAYNSLKKSPFKKEGHWEQMTLYDFMDMEV